MGGAAVVSAAAAGGLLFTVLWPGDILFWQMSGVLGSAIFLCMLMLRGKYSLEGLLRAGGAALALLGAGMILNFRDILSGGVAIWAVSLPLLGTGLAMMIDVTRTLRQPFFAAAMATCFLGGLLGWADRIILSDGGVTGVYDPVDRGRGVFFIAEPCFLVTGDSGDVSILPGGHGGIFPEYAKPADVGKRIGPYRIIGVVEKGAEIQVYNVGGRRMAVLDFSLVSPAAATAAAVINSPI